jgi:hypothetical protein
VRVEKLSQRKGLLVAPCSYEAAKYAVMNWHYSRRMPRGRLATFGAWECDRFVGAVIFGLGVTAGLGDRFGLVLGEVVELVRVALTTHDAPVTHILALATRQLERANPCTRLVVSFADPDQGHYGGVYQAGNWIYAGMTIPADEYIVRGRRYHGRALRNLRAHAQGRRAGTTTLEWARATLDPGTTVVKGSAKYRYLMPLDRAMRRQVAKLAQPYPKRADEVSTVTR